MVLVILAILAAIMVPALTGWIDKAKERQDVINARSAYLAAQTIASEMYATNDKLAAKDFDDTVIAKITTLAEVNGTVKITGVVKGKITGMTYKGAGDNGKEYTYDSEKNGWNFLAS